MDIHHFIGKKSHTETCWVMTQKGYEHLKKKGISPETLARRMPGMPVENYFKSCPMWWVHNGWVEEAEGQLQLF